MNSQPQILLFSYGSNNIQQLASRLGISEDQLRSSWPLDSCCVEPGRRCHSWGSRPIYKAKLPKAKRIFTNSQIAIRNGKTGVATIISSNSSSDCVLGFAIQLTEQELLKLDEFEGVRYGKYLRTSFKIKIILDRQYIDAYAVAYVIPSQFLANKCVGYVQPSDHYLASVACTINDGGWYKNNGARFTKDDIPLNIY